MTNKLRDELAQASNIKSKQTKSFVSEALRKIVQHLGTYKKTPENGVVIFAGNVVDEDKVELFAVTPPQKLSVKKYVCGGQFFMEPLEKMLSSTEIYGIVAMDGNEATIAMLDGVEVKILKRMVSLIPNKTTKGGQSKARYQRDRQEKQKTYFKKLAETAVQFFRKKTKAVLVGGPGPLKEYFLNAVSFYGCGEVHVIDVGYADECGVREIIQKSKDILEKQELVEEQKTLEAFKTAVFTEGLATYGIREVEEALVGKRAETLLLSEECELKDKFLEMAKENETEVRFISAKTELGSEFLSGFKGLGAMLRW